MSKINNRILRYYIYDVDWWFSEKEVTEIFYEKSLLVSDAWLMIELRQLSWGWVEAESDGLGWAEALRPWHICSLSR